MAKASKPRKKKEVKPEIEVPLVENEFNTVTELVEEPAPTVEEIVEEVVVEEPVAAVEPEPVVEPIVITVKEVAQNKMPEGLTLRQKIEWFLQGKSGILVLNDFLRQHCGGSVSELKTLANTLESLKPITVTGNIHLRLGKSFYRDAYRVLYDLSNTRIEVRL